MNEQNKKPYRKVDNLVSEVDFWWKKTLVYATRKQIRTWHGLIAILFVIGIIGGIILSISLGIESRSKASTGSAILTWQANTESDLAGYKIYYGTTPRTGTCPAGGYTSIIDAGKVTSYTVANLAEGATYYFSVSAYDTSRNESCFSAEVSKKIPVTVTTCTSFTYSAWGACQSNNTQTRTVLTSSPSGCTGGTPILSQSCTYVPPVTTCTSFTYSAWGACQSDNTQTRTVLTSSPSGCTGGTPVLTQSCTYVQPVSTTCTSFTYTKWGSCINGLQTRIALTASPLGCSGGNPLLTRTCKGKRGK